MNRKINVVCDKCGKGFYKRPSALKRDKSNCCSLECSSQLSHELRVKPIEDKFGKNIKEILSELYIDNMLSTREIAKIINVSVNKTQEYLHKYEIEVRHGGEAVKTQWINNPERREQSKQIALNHLQTKKSRDKVREVQKTKEYKKLQSVSKQGENNGMYGVYGSKHHNWNPNITNYERIVGRKTRKDVQWREEVYKRDNYTCIVCGDDKGRNLNAHHLYSHNKYKDKRYDLDNGITLCVNCHKEFHNQYGYGDNTKEQFEKFIKNDLALTV